MIEPQQIYRHYKGGLYRILAVGLYVETKVKTVVYQNIDADVTYPDLDNPDKIWIRAVDVFLQEIEHEGKTVPRFTRVD